MTLGGDKPIRVLAFWGDTFRDYFEEAFLNNPRFEVELGEPARSSELIGRLKASELDLVLGGTSHISPGMEGIFSAAQQARVPLAAIDLLETSYVLPEDFELLKASTLYFKLNLYCWPRRSLMPLETFFSMRRVTAQTSKLRPLTWGVSSRSIPDQAPPIREREIDLCLIAPRQKSGPLQEELLARCQGLRGRYQIFTTDNGLPAKDLASVLQRSRLVVCAENGGCESPLDYEAAASGAVPLLNWPSAQNHRPFQPEEQALYFSMIGGDFERTVARALGDPAKLERIAANARAFTLQQKQRSSIGVAIAAETLQAHAARV